MPPGNEADHVEGPHQQQLRPAQDRLTGADVILPSPDRRSARLSDTEAPSAWRWRPPSSSRTFGILPSRGRANIWRRRSAGTPRARRSSRCSRNGSRSAGVPRSSCLRGVHGRRLGKITSTILRTVALHCTSSRSAALSPRRRHIRRAAGTPGSKPTSFRSDHGEPAAPARSARSVCLDRSNRRTNAWPALGSSSRSATCTGRTCSGVPRRRIAATSASLLPRSRTALLRDREAVTIVSAQELRGRSDGGPAFSRQGTFGRESCHQRRRLRRHAHQAVADAQRGASALLRPRKQDAASCRAWG